MENDDIREMLRDLIWLNAFIATELVQITENTSAILRKGPVPASCLAEHGALRALALEIAERYRPKTPLRDHVVKHQ